MLTFGRVTVIALIIVAVAYGFAQPAPPAIFGGKSLLDAHNAYPEDGKYRDRFARAMATGLAPLVIEQDVSYNAPARQSVVSHDTELDGTEPSLEQHFFAPLKPLLDAAVAVGAKDHWPMFVLHLDFKTNEREHHRAVWDLLVSHRSWLMTAAAPANSSGITAFAPGPLLVLTENGRDQEKDFSEWAKVSGTHLLFGTIPGPAIPSNTSDDERARLLATLPANQLIPATATSYRRWVNFPWGAIERGGPPRAGDWTSEDQSRLGQVVAYAHQQGLLIRFYTLNGHGGPNNRGWSASYNFGSLDAAKQRWRAAVGAHVDLIATDQYEEFAAVLHALEK